MVYSGWCTHEGNIIITRLNQFGINDCLSALNQQNGEGGVCTQLSVECHCRVLHATH